MTFEEALSAVKDGYRVTREGWNGKGQYIEMQKPTESSKMTKPYLYIKNAQGDFVPWLASQGDLLEEDWFEV